MSRSSNQSCAASNPEEDPIKRILELLGPAVLIALRDLSKAAGPGWNRRTLDDMRDPNYLASLKGRNLGVLLGAPSKNLCSIDIDRDECVEQLLEVNPKLRNTLRTCRKRGCNLWIRAIGPLPPSTRIKLIKDGKTIVVGELRSTGNHTAIHGSVIDPAKGETQPTRYRILVEAPPIQIEFADIRLPLGWTLTRAAPPPLRLDSESASCVGESLDRCVSGSVSTCDDASLRNTMSAVESLKLRNAAERLFKAEHKGLHELYRRHVESRFQAIAGARNAFIVDAIPFLYRAVAEDVAVALVMLFYDTNRALFNDPRDQHKKEAVHMITAVAQSYLADLKGDEEAVYELLDDRERAAFRICRDFALTPDENRPEFMFFMSCNQLGIRLGVAPMQAQRIMRNFQSHGLIRLLKKGTMRAAGVAGKAGEYEWLCRGDSEAQREVGQ